MKSASYLKGQRSQRCYGFYPEAPWDRSVWDEESECNLVRANIKEKVHCSFNEGSGDKDTFHYPCLEVYVNLTNLGQMVMLYHTEDTVHRNRKCSYIPPDMENYTEVQQQVENVRDNFRKHQTFLCHYDPSGKEKSVLLKRLYPPEGLLVAFAWPSLLLIGGILIVIMVKLTQYLAVISATQRRARI
ncbi:calcium-activated potassium channel subunit beta-1 isoform X2 [Candoia aspera]|uniref:calcium-activated potassium channel subunit beta-1 isoform X2 n=1 Tax=Candoia aspera TaxID=51853 RepID=UPI002FD81567